VDEEDRRYFKQQEIILWRKGEKTRKPFQASLQQQYKQMQNPNVQFASSDQSIGSADKNNPLGSSNKDGEPNENDPASTTVSNKTKDYRSPLEQGSSSEEQPTPDKEFQSVINSKEVDSLTSPENEDNPITAPSVKDVPNNNTPSVVAPTKENEESSQQLDQAQDRNQELEESQESRTKVDTENNMPPQEDSPEEKENSSEKTLQEPTQDKPESKKGNRKAKESSKSAQNEQKEKRKSPSPVPAD